MAIYMEYEGLKGNVTAAGYEGMIRLDFAVLRATRDVSMAAGSSRIANLRCRNSVLLKPANAWIVPPSAFCANASRVRAASRLNFILCIPAKISCRNS